MAFSTAQARENAALGLTNSATHMGLFSTAAGATAGTEPSGGSPAYARKAITWVPGSVDGSVTTTVTFDVPAGFSAQSVGLFTAITGGTFLDSAAVTTQAFASQGTYTVTYTVTVN